MVTTLVRFDEIHHDRGGDEWYDYKVLVVRPEGVVTSRHFNSQSDEDRVMKEFPDAPVIGTLEGAPNAPRWNLDFEKAHADVCDLLRKAFPAARLYSHGQLF